MYHSVSNADEAGVGPYYRLSTSPGLFREHMSFLSDNGYIVTGIPELLNGGGADHSNSRRVVVTFDDGYLDFLTGAWPSLEHFGYKATVFLATAYVGHARRQFRHRECLTWPEVCHLAKHGVCFGSHTVTHPVLHGMPWEDVRRELRDSRDEIEAYLGTPVTAFAYPFAFPHQDRLFVSMLGRELRSLGYSANLTTLIGRHAPGDDPLRVKRLPVNGADDIALFSAKLAGAYDWLGTLQVAWKHAR